MGVIGWHPMTWDTPRLNGIRHGRTSLQNRCLSSPALDRAAVLFSADDVGRRQSIRESSNRSQRSACCSDAPVFDWGPGDSSELRPELVRPRKVTEDRVREECHCLRQELAERRGEEQQLLRRVQLLEGSLQLRTQQLDDLMHELRDASEGGACPAELLERLATAHAVVYEQLEMQGQERQVQLRERLAETQSESQKLLAQIRSDCRRNHPTYGPPLRPAAVPRTPVSGGSLSSGNIRKQRRQQEDMFAAYEQLQRQVEKMAEQLEEERKARLEKELTSKQLAEVLAQAGDTSGVVSAHTKVRPSSAGQLPPVIVDAGHVPLRDAKNFAAAQTFASQGDMAQASAFAYRQEMEALKEAEKNQRAARRKCRATAAVDTVAAASEAVAAWADAPDDHPEPEESIQTAIPQNSSSTVKSTDAEEAAELRQALRALEAKYATLEEVSSSQFHALEAAEQRVADVESLVSEVCLAEQSAIDAAKVAEERVWAATQAANELALQADLRYVEALERELRSQQEIRALRERCEVLQSVANAIAQTSCR